MKGLQEVLAGLGRKSKSVSCRSAGRDKNGGMKLFVTPIYRAMLDTDASELEAACLSIAEDDEAGQLWCEEQG